MTTVEVELIDVSIIALTILVIVSLVIAAYAFRKAKETTTQ